jgi:hypothetical protein
VLVSALFCGPAFSGPKFFTELALGRACYLEDDEMDRAQEKLMSSSHDSRTFDQRDPPNEQRPVVPATRARQGVTGHNVRYVLGFGVVGVIVAFVVIWLIYFG